MSARPPGDIPEASPATIPPPVHDDRAVRITVARVEGMGGAASTVVAPTLATSGPTSPSRDATPRAIVDGEPSDAALERFDRTHATLVMGDGHEANRTNVLFGPVRPGSAPGVRLRAIVVGGWLIEVEIEDASRAALRERARRGASVAGHGGPAEIRAIIPGRVVAVSVAPGDSVVAGQQVLVVEAMKMQNELRAPREGTVARIGVAIGDTIDVGDLLVVIH